MKLTTTLIMGQVTLVAMGFVDSAMAGRINALALAAMAIGYVVWTIGLLFIIGALMVLYTPLYQISETEIPSCNTLNSHEH